LIAGDWAHDSDAMLLLAVDDRQCDPTTLIVAHHVALACAPKGGSTGAHGEPAAKQALRDWLRDGFRRDRVPADSGGNGSRDTQAGREAQA
jgi:hypothetical protein